jgi:hypothetical protein
MVAPLLLLLAATASPLPASAQKLVGVYDGHQMEMAVGIELKADGRFDYGLSYGAMDEQAAGRWTVSDGKVLLTSDPVKAPRFTFVGQKPATAGNFEIALDVPKGMSAQYFDGMFVTAKGHGDQEQLRDDGPRSWVIDKADPPVKAMVALQMFGLHSDPVTIDPAKGYSLQFRFEPNDLGKVDFKATALIIDKGDLLLDRFDRHIRFHRAAKP